MAAEAAPPSLSVLVNNIPFDTRKSELEDFFKSCGSITDVHLPSDRRSGKPKGFAFVRFAQQRDADEAIGLSGKEFGGRVIGVHYAKPRDGNDVPNRDRDRYRERSRSRDRDRYASRSDRDRDFRRDERRDDRRRDRSRSPRAGGDRDRERDREPRHHNRRGSRERRESRRSRS